MEGQVNLVITTEQLRAAPAGVRQWFAQLAGIAPPADSAWVVEHNGRRETAEQVAILDEAEAETLVGLLADDPAAIEILALFSDDCRDPASGAPQAYSVSVTDMVDRTSIASAAAVPQHITRIEKVLRRARGDHTLFLFEGHPRTGYCVHPETQAALHRLRERAAAPPAGEADDGGRDQG